LEIGVQTLDNTIYRKVNRGHNLDDVYEAFQTAKDSGYKIVAHMMPGLPGSTPQRDLEDFKFLFSDERLRPDMLKIYPTLVLKDTGLYHLYKAGKYSTYSDEEFANLLTEIKKIVPNWVRIMRIQREIDSPDIIAGPKLGNLRQLVQKRLSKSGYECNCIRCREVGIPNGNSIDYNPMVMRSNYVSSDGMESFLSLEDPKAKCLFAFLRLRRLKNPHRNELTVSGVAGAIIRELHVYGQVTDVGKCSAQGSFQHRGFGSKLLRIAEEIVSGEFGLKKLSVISAVGTREYYKKFGYKNDGPYMSKIL
jgi:elongator complex protein 3